MIDGLIKLMLYLWTSTTIYLIYAFICCFDTYRRKKDRIKKNTRAKRKALIKELTAQINNNAWRYYRI